MGGYFSAGQRRSALGPQGEADENFIGGPGGPRGRGPEGPARQRREEVGGGAVAAGQQAQPGPGEEAGGTRGGLQGAGGAARTG